MHLVAAALRHLEVEGAGEMQRLDVVEPGEGNLVVAPAAADQHGDLVVAGALERPIVECGDAFDDIERVRPWMLCELRLRHAVPKLSLVSGLVPTPTPRARDAVRHARQPAPLRRVTQPIDSIKANHLRFRIYPRAESTRKFSWA
jgi:hypothetical protein